MANRQIDTPLLSVVLPIYNEAGVIEPLFAQVRDSAQSCGIDYEIIFVDDGSTDSSGEMLDALAANNACVRVIHLARNFGHQAAVLAGLTHAGGDAVVLMDSDLQDAPETIPRFVNAWRDGFDVVYAVRVARKESLWKRILFASFHRLLAKVSSATIPADAGNFSLMDRRVVRQIVALNEHDRYLPGLRGWVGFRQKGIEVERGARYDCRPRVSLWGLCRLAKTALFSFSTFPLTVFHLIGYLATATFLGLSGYSLYCRLFTDQAIPGWTSHILSASFFGALNALGISILGEYVVRIYDQVRGRPIYVVDRVVAGSNETGAAEEPQVDEADVGEADAAEVVQQLRTMLAAVRTGEQSELIGHVPSEVKPAPTPFAKPR